jgi:tryptophanyl-tRNA synthetase
VRYLSGIQPSGRLHLGNYFGAMRPQIELQDKGEAFYFIANLHALTTIHDGPRLAELTRDVALDYLALGLDPAKAVLFKQSDVPEVTELAWILSSVTGMGLLERAVSYKEKIEKGIAASVGLFFYPVLMAADILIYRAGGVPVGKDQSQHLEMARDMATRFNEEFQSQVFPMPATIVQPSAGVLPGVDGQKMSKSYNNTIPIFAEGKELKELVMGIKTDSRSPAEPKGDPEENTVYLLYSQVASPEDAEAMAKALREGGMGYGDMKKKLLAALDAYLGPARARRKELAAGGVDEILRAGAEKARRAASETMTLVRKATGLL